jgi:hypothetical protein
MAVPTTAGEAITDQLRRRALCYQGLGFIATIGLCMVDELVGLSNLLLKDQSCITQFRESVPKALLILLVWFLVAGSTRRLLSQVRYLDSFMKVCAWCRRVEHGGNWIPFERLLKQQLDTTTSHGICQDCLAKATAVHAVDPCPGGPRP